MHSVFNTSNADGENVIECECKQRCFTGSEDDAKKMNYVIHKFTHKCLFIHLIKNYDKYFYLGVSRNRFECDENLENARIPLKQHRKFHSLRLLCNPNNNNQNM